VSAVTLVLLAVDDTPESAHAARAARALFGPAATYVAVTVADDTAFTPTYPLVEDDLTDARAAAEDETRRSAHDVARDAGVAAASVGRLGDPVDAILETAEQQAADVIVVGSSDKSWWRRLVDGSVSHGIVAAADRPVLVIPAEA
jgi:nucleotide-binding universal stress UspA family protein